MLLKDAPILLPDKATSNLDGATEQCILRALDANRRGRTIVVIAHRLGTIVNADRIVVMADGEVVETGTHEELWSRRGRYFELFRAQVGLAVPPSVPEPERALAVGRVA
jgi:ABC-type multidrug transport system fused ATPase/permease subunit